MIIDASSIQNSDVVETDICVVGAGIAGISFAREFLNTDRQIVLLESGGNDLTSPQDLNKGINTGLPYFELDSARARAFGGTSHLWHVDVNQPYKAVRLRGLDEIDFEKKDWVPFSGWPIQKKDLDPYYESAHRIFKIGPYSYHPSVWISENEQISLPFQQDRIGTTVVQFARWDHFFTTYRTEIEKSENITAYTDATVLRINTNESITHTSDVDVSTSAGISFKVYAKNFIMALGGIENPRLLLLSRSQIEKGLGNKNDLVGRFFMEHPHLTSNSGRFFPANPDIFRKPDIYNLRFKNGVPVLGYLVLSAEVIRNHQLLNFTVRISGENEYRIPRLDESIQSVSTIHKSIKTGKLPKNMMKNIGKLIKNADVLSYAAASKLFGAKNYNLSRFEGDFTGIPLGIMAEQSPDPESRVRLSHEKDRFGQPKIDLKWKLNSSDIRSIRGSLEIIDKEMRNDNIGHIEFNLDSNEPPSELKGGYHHMGTTRMHDSPEFGVVDKNCKVHGVDNLFIAGSSVFPTGGYANPTLTVAALSIRLADYIKKSSQERKVIHE